MISDVKKFVARTPHIIGIALALTVIMFFVEFTGTIIKVLNNKSGIPSDYDGTTTSSYIGDFFAGLSNLPLAQTAAVVIVFAIIGVGLYVFGLFVANILVDVRNEIAVSRDDIPEIISFKYILWHARGKIRAIVIYVVLLVLSLGLLFGVWFGFIESYLVSGMQTTFLPALVGGLTALFINMYLLIAGGFIISEYGKSVTSYRNY